MSVAPPQFGEAEIDVAEGDANRDMAYREWRLSKRFGLLLQRVDRDIRLQLPGLHVLDRLSGGRAQHLAAPHEHGIEHAVSQRMTAQCNQALGPFHREQLVAIMQGVEVLTYHDRVV